MKLCMNLSKIMYSQENNEDISDSLKKFVTEDIKQALNVVDDKIIAKIMITITILIMWHLQY